MLMYKTITAAQTMSFDLPSGALAYQHFYSANQHLVLFLGMSDLNNLEVLKAYLCVQVPKSKVPKLFDYIPPHINELLSVGLDAEAIESMWSELYGTTKVKVKG